MVRPNASRILSEAFANASKGHAKEAPQSFRLSPSALLGFEILAHRAGVSQGQYIAQVLEEHIQLVFGGLNDDEGEAE